MLDTIEERGDTTPPLTINRVENETVRRRYSVSSIAYYSISLFPLAYMLPRMGVPK